VHLLRQLAATAILLTVTAAPALADGLVVPFVGFNFGGDSGSNCVGLTTCKQKHTNFGVSFISMGTVFGLEEDISYAKNFFGETPDQANSVFSAMTNLVVGPGVGPVRPYVVGGVGLIRPHVSSLASSVTSFDTNKNAFGYDVGGGVTILFGKRVGVRGDLRNFHTMQNVNLLVFTGQKLAFWRASAGLALAF
jgi:opacity protein-like surface antigen